MLSAGALSCDSTRRNDNPTDIANYVVDLLETDADQLEEGVLIE